MPFLSSDLPDPGIETISPALAGRVFTAELAGKPWFKYLLTCNAGSWKKQESSRKNTYFCFIDYAKAFDCVDHNKL